VGAPVDMVDHPAAAAAMAVQAAVESVTSLASPLDTLAVTDTATEGTSPCHGGSGIPAASATTRDTDSVSEEVAVVVSVVATEVVMEAVVAVAVMEEVEAVAATKLYRSDLWFTSSLFAQSLTERPTPYRFPSLTVLLSLPSMTECSAMDSVLAIGSVQTAAIVASISMSLSLFFFIDRI